MNVGPAVQAQRDEEHLKLLSVFYCIAGALTGLIALFPLMYACFGLMIALTGAGVPEKSNLDWAQSAIVGGCFAFCGGVAFLLLGVLAVLMVYTGSALARRRSRVLCMVTAGLLCLGGPYGIVLGVLTFLVLSRPSVEALFDP